MPDQHSYDKLKKKKKMNQMNIKLKKEKKRKDLQHSEKGSEEGGYSFDTKMAGGGYIGYLKKQMSSMEQLHLQ